MKYLVFFLIFLLVGCSNDEYVTNETTFFVMDTYVDVQVFTEEPDEDVLTKLEELFTYYHCLTNRYDRCDEATNVYDINHMEEGYLEIDEELQSLINYGKDFYEKTDGRLNIAMGDLIDYWKERINKQDYIPSEQDLANFTYQPITMEEERILVDVNIDLGSLAKGYALERAAELLADLGYDKYLINAGGQVLVGDSYRNDAYRIGVKHPTETGNLTVVNGTEMNVSTSGGYERFFELDDEKFHHIIDPITAYSADKFLSVTVIAADSLLADALTTALFLMPLEDGKELLAEYDAEALWYTQEGEMVRSEGFAVYE